MARLRGTMTTLSDWPDSEVLQSPVDYIWDAHGKRVRGAGLMICAMDLETGLCLSFKPDGEGLPVMEKRNGKLVPVYVEKKFAGPLTLCCNGYMIGRSRVALPKA